LTSKRISEASLKQFTCDLRSWVGAWRDAIRDYATPGALSRTTISQAVDRLIDYQLMHQRWGIDRRDVES
jgi:hypothetical protein